MPTRTKKTKVATPGFTHIRTLRGVSEYVLKSNGLRVLFVPVPGSNTVTTNIVYHVGSRHEARGKTGLAHMLEHMMFKPTHDGTGKKHKVPGHVLLQNKGAVMNATTWTDRTNYYFHLPVRYLPDMLQTEAVRMRNITIDEKEFLPERRNVLSEYEMGEGDPLEALDKLMNGQAFYAHGYGHSTIGFKPDIESYVHTDLADFYNTYYWPNNATLVVVGDVTAALVLKEVRAAFGKIPRSPHHIPQDRVIEPPQEGERRVAISRPGPINIIGVAYRAPELRSRDWAVAEVLLTHLTDGPTSVLYKALIETHMASSISPMLYPSHDPYFFLIYAYASVGIAHTEVEARIKRAIADAHASTISKGDLTRAQTKIITSEKYRRDGTLTIASQLTEYVASGDWTRYHTVLDDIASVTSADIRAFAQKYLRPESAVVGHFYGAATEHG